jgi:hypothetical protein
MIALRVKLNGKELCVAGADDLCVLDTIIGAVGNLGAKTKQVRDEPPDLHLSVSGLTGRRSGADYHLAWVRLQEIVVGDRIEVELMETSGVDAPTSKQKARTREELRRKLDQCHRKANRIRRKAKK